ncbi:WD40 repeat domain-containing serine/threonine protein kinase [Caulifigura coniformis]|nr:serine/threonine-protein kinase [Caulifigura coniformis]
MSPHRPSPEPTSAGHPAAPGSLGRYRLENVLGQGAFGRVYRAFDSQLERYVALKELLSAGRSPARLSRFVNEARFAGRLRHPNIVPTFESGEVDGRYFITSQFIDGLSLADLARSQRPAPRQCVQWTMALANSLAYAHSMGIVHRDVKPANILVDDRNEPQLADFGLAMTREVATRATVDGAILGSPAYMSPEQARGDIAAVGPASDQFSLGVTLFELLAGRPPFEGSSHLVISRIVSTEVPSVRSVAPLIDQDLDAIVRKSTRPDITERYGSCAELAEDLGRWLEGRETLARPETWLQRWRRWHRRERAMSRLLTALIAALAFIAIGGSAAAWRQTALTRIANHRKRDAEESLEKQRQAQGDLKRSVHRETAARAEAVTAKHLAEQRADSERAIAHRLRTTAYGAEMALAESAWHSNQIRRVTEMLRRQIPAEGAEDLRGFEWHYQAALLKTQMTEYASPNWYGRFALSSDGRRIVILTSTGARQFAVTPLNQTPDELVAPAGTPGRSPDPTIETCVHSASPTLDALLHDTGAPDSAGRSRGPAADPQRVAASPALPPGTLRIAPEKAALGHLAYLPDGQTLACRTSTDLTTWKPSNSTLPGIKQPVSGAAAANDRLSMSRDGLVVTAGDVVSVIDLTAKPPTDVISTRENRGGPTFDKKLEPVWTLQTLAPRRSLFARISPNGKLVAAGFPNRTIVIWNLATGGSYRVVTLDADPVDLEFDSASHAVAVITESGALQLMEVAGKLLWTRPAAPGIRLTRVSFDRTDRVVVGTDLGEVTLLDARSGVVDRTLRRHHQSITDITVDPLHNVLWSMDSSGRLCQWSLASRAVERHFASFGSPIASIACAPDGSWIAVLPRHEDPFLFERLARRVAAPATRPVRIFDTEDGRLIATLNDDDTDAPPTAGRAERIMHAISMPRVNVSLAVNRAGDRLAVGRKDGRCTIYDTATWRPVSTIGLFPAKKEGWPTQFLAQLGYSSSEDRLLALSSNLAMVSVPTDARWPILFGNGQPTVVSESVQNATRQVDFSTTGLKDRKVLAHDLRGARFVEQRQTADGPRLCVVSLHTGEILQAIEERPAWIDTITDSALSLDGRWFIAMRQTGWSTVWDLDTGEKQFEALTHSGRMSSVEFSPDGSRLLIGASGLLRLWSLRSVQELRSFTGDGGRFLPDGRRLLIYGENGKLRIIDAR